MNTIKCECHTSVMQAAPAKTGSAQLRVRCQRIRLSPIKRLTLRCFEALNVWLSGSTSVTKRSHDSRRGGAELHSSALEFHPWQLLKEANSGAGVGGNAVQSEQVVAVRPQIITPTELRKMKSHHVIYSGLLVSMAMLLCDTLAPGQQQLLLSLKVP